MVKSSIPALAEQDFKSFAGQAGSIMMDFLEKSKTDIRTYSLMLAANKITEDEYRSSIRGKLQIGKTRLLEIKGLGEAGVDKFLAGLENAFVTGVLKMVV